MPYVPSHLPHHFGPGMYINDTYVVIEGEPVDAFTTHINNISPSTDFTMERKENGKLPMLDTMIHMADNGKPRVTIFRKPTHTHQYLSMNSHHPLQHKLGVIRTLGHRAKTLVTNPEDGVANNKASPGLLWLQTVTFRLSQMPISLHLETIKTLLPLA